MQKRDKYFWDGDRNISPQYRLRRYLEYASFPDLLDYPFDEFKRYLPEISIERLRTSEKRKKMLQALYPYLDKAHSWDSLFKLWLKIDL